MAWSWHFFFLNYLSFSERTGAEALVSSSKWFAWCFSGIILPWSRVAIFKFFILDNFDLEWHSCFINDFVHAGSKALVSERGRLSQWFVTLWLAVVITWSWHFILWLFKSVICIFGPVNSFVAASLAEIRSCFDVVAAWALIFFCNGGVNKDRMGCLCIFGVG